jgi:GTP diphosphokinase / guanosine-3',5'-bis(diphosphate) 3'-diphosphatase
MRRDPNRHSVHTAGPADLQRLIHAIDFAAERHRHQRRKDKRESPYINHPIALMRVLSVEAGIHDVDVLIGAVLHDTIEDTDTTEQDIERLFGRTVADLVLEVTDDTALDHADRRRLQIESAPHKSAGAAMIKLADKTCNLRDMIAAPPHWWDDRRRADYFRWARNVVDRLPVVHVKLLGIFDEAWTQGRRRIAA